MPSQVLNKTLKSIAILFPFILVYLGAIFLKVHPPTGTLLKITAFFYMILYVLWHRKTDINLLFMTVLFSLFMIYAVWNSFDIRAGIEDGLRYFFPIVTLFYGYSIRQQLPLLIKFIIVFIILNFLVQIVNYINWQRGVVQWFYHITPSGLYYFNQTMGILRASGFVVFFAFFGYMNMIAFFMIKKYYHGKFKIVFLSIAILMLLASISYKTIGSLLIVFIFYYYKKMFRMIAGFMVLLISIMLAFPADTKKFIDNLLYRLNAYILMKTPTVRAETYQLMWKEISDFNLFGHGAGSFGGPASLKYNSPYYKEVNFIWHDTFWMKMTTVDTFPPHVFIELGIIGGLLFFLVLLTPIIRRKVSAMVLIIYFTLFFDMLFTFSLAGLEYLMFSLVFVYPIYYYEKHRLKNGETAN